MRYRLLVSCYKQRKPEWQDYRPRHKAGRDAYAIAAKHQSSFTRAFLRLIREMLPESAPSNFKSFYDKGDTDGAMSQLPLWGVQLKTEAWDNFLADMDRAYTKVIAESSEAATTEMNRALGLNVSYVTLVNDKDKGAVKRPAESNSTILKADIPVNPYAIKWIKERALELISTRLAPTQEKIIRDVLVRNFESGNRAELTYKTIKENIGLTERDYKAVLNRRQMHFRAGIKEPRLTKLIERYREKLLKARAQTIARTETIKAQGVGRRATWEMASDQGYFEGVDVVRVWDSAPESPNPNRPCPICTELDGKQVPIGESYISSTLGELDGAPAHPRCRCTERLEELNEI